MERRLNGPQHAIGGGNGSSGGGGGGAYGGYYHHDDDDDDELLLVHGQQQVCMWSCICHGCTWKTSQQSGVID